MSTIINREEVSEGFIFRIVCFMSSLLNREPFFRENRFFGFHCLSFEPNLHYVQKLCTQLTLYMKKKERKEKWSERDNTA